jgi:hypothetical protein
VEAGLDRVDVGEVVAGRPVREFRWVKGQRHYSGWYWSATTGGLVVYESLLELDRIMLADFANDVVGIAAQPFQLIGADGDRTRRHVPDVLLVHAGGGVTVVDVKPAHRLDDPNVQAVFGWTDRIVAGRGWSFEVWSCAPAGLLRNVRFLAGYRRASVVDHSLSAPVLEAAAGGATIAGVERAVRARAGMARPVVLHLLWHGRLTADLSAPLGGATVVRAATGSAR